MLENRSFDHMLGFLSAESGRADVEGLGANLENSAGGKAYPTHPAKMTKLVKAQDPCHSGWCADEQVADGQMSGFAANYAKTRPKQPFKSDSPATVMTSPCARALSRMK